MEEGKSSGNKVVMAKIPREDYIDLQRHCKIKNESINSAIKNAIKNEIKDTIPHMLAGKNLFLYNRYKDNFSWKVMLDNGLRVDIEDDLPAESVSQLLDSLKQAVDERNTYIKKESKDAVPIPSKLVRKGI